MDETLAQECVRRMILGVLKRTGFDAASPDSILELEDKVFLLFGGLLHIAHEYAELARRTRPGVPDFLEACNNQGITLDGLGKLIQQNKLHRDDLPVIRTDASTSQAIQDPSKTFLLDSPGDATQQAPYAPSHLPYLPPSHSYKQTPVYPPIATPEQAAAAGMPLINAFGPGKQAIDPEHTSADARISQLDSRIRTTRLVEASLQSLIRATSKSKNVQQQQQHEQPGKQEEMEDGSMAEGAVVQTSKEDIAVLLERYEKDAAVCNFELEWYGKGSNQAANVNAVAVNNQASGQRKRGRWKV